MGRGEFHAPNLFHNKLNVTKSFSLIIRALEINSCTATLAARAAIWLDRHCADCNALENGIHRCYLHYNIPHFTFHLGIWTSLSSCWTKQTVMLMSSKKNSSCSSMNREKLNDHLETTDLWCPLQNVVVWVYRSKCLESCSVVDQSKTFHFFGTIQLYCFCHKWPFRLLHEPRPCQYKRYRPWQHPNHNTLILGTASLTRCHLQTWITLLNCTRNRAWDGNKQTNASASTWNDRNVLHRLLVCRCTTWGMFNLKA